MDTTPSSAPVTAPRRVGLLVSPRSVLRWCLIGALFFLVADLVALIAVINGADSMALLPRLFDTDLETNPPAWFSSLLLAAAALAAAMKARQEHVGAGLWWKHWAGLSVLFLALSLDEASALHEETAGPLKHVAESLGVSGDVARLGAVSIIVVVLLVLAVPLTRWQRAQPQWARRAYVAAVVLFVGAALGLETLARLLEEWRGYLDLEQGLLSGLEEVVEMIASTTLLVTTLSLLDGEAA